MSIYDKSSLVLIPSGTKTGKVFSQKPVSGDGDFTFTRASAATRVNADGNIEKETQNLFYQSNNFSSGFWLQSGSVTGGQTDRNGGSDAWIVSSVLGSALIGYQTITLSGVYTFSIYVKINASNGFGIGFGSLSNAARFDISDTTKTSAVTETGLISSSQEYVGNNFYRLSITANMSGSTQMRMYLTTADGTASDTNGGTQIVQDAQLEQGLVARDYIETTTPVYGGITDNTPRLDYTDSSCPALLLEPLRTNSITSSEYFGNWNTISNVTLNHNNDNSPEGVQNATQVVPNTSNANHFLDKSGFNRTNGEYITTTIYAKANGYDYLYLSLSASRLYGVFDISNGVVMLTNSNTTDFINDSGNIEAVGNGWYRCTLIGQAQNTNATYLRVSCAPTSSNTHTPTYAGDGTSGVLIYGVQVETNASYATSYIPTYGSSVSRVQDNPNELINVSTNGILNNYNSTAFIHIKKNLGTTGLTRFLALYSASGNNPRILLYAGNNATFFNLNLQYRVSGQSDVGDFMGTFNNDEEIKVALVLNGTTMTSYVNGVKKNTNTIVQGADIEKLVLDDAGELSHLVSKLLLFPSALTDQEAIDLTTI